MNKLLRNAIFGLALLLIMASFSGCGSNLKSFDALISDGDEIRLYEIFGMDCPGCHGGVENLIENVPGVKGSYANWEKQQLQVLIAKGAEVSDEAIFEAVKKANFTPGKRLR